MRSWLGVNTNVVGLNEILARGNYIRYGVKLRSRLGVNTNVVGVKLGSWLGVNTNLVVLN